MTEAQATGWIAYPWLMLIGEVWLAYCLAFVAIANRIESLVAYYSNGPEQEKAVSCSELRKIYNGGRDGAETKFTSEGCIK